MNVCNIILDADASILFKISDLYRSSTSVRYELRSLTFPY
jgi:hypothetical protein